MYRQEELVGLRGLRKESLRKRHLSRTLKGRVWGGGYGKCIVGVRKKRQYEYLKKRSCSWNVEEPSFACKSRMKEKESGGRENWQSGLQSGSEECSVPS